MTSKAVAVIIGDIHFSVGTLKLASAALLQARDCAYSLNVPLILNGDTLDTKAIIRAEVANDLIEILEWKPSPTIIINTGNHDLISEKGADSALNFLSPYADVVKTPTYYESFDSWIIPYQSDTKKLIETLSSIPEGSRLIVHQGVQTAFLGHYVQDTSSVPKDVFRNYRVIASHYHRKQDIKCGPPKKGAVGLFSYIGNPYTLSFAESEDPPKGYSVLYENGLIETVPLSHLRKHIVIERNITNLFDEVENYIPGDIVWLKVRGIRSQLLGVNKKHLGNRLFGHDNYKLDLIVEESEKVNLESEKKFNENEILDNLIDGLNETDSQKVILKQLWRDVLNENISG